MESPTRNSAECSFSKLDTPKHTKKLYWPKYTEEGSPKMCGFPEKQEEFGWDDSPEPLKFDPKLITGYSKKKIDCLESPVSSHPKKRIQRRTSPKKFSQSTDKDLAYMQELSRRILSTCSVPMPEQQSITSNIVPSTKEHTPAKIDISLAPKKAISSAQSRNTTSKDKNIVAHPQPTAECGRNDCSPLEIADHSFDSVLQSFFQAEEEDEWLSQIDVAPEKQTPNKCKFSKSMSDNNLESPSRSSSFRRSASFQSYGDTARSKPEPSVAAATAKRAESTSSISQSENLPPDGLPQPLKKQKSFHIESTTSQTVCSWEEIEKKRLEAKFRREFKEIERKKLEALRRLNERRNREPIKR